MKKNQLIPALALFILAPFFLSAQSDSLTLNRYWKKAQLLRDNGLYKEAASLYSDIIDMDSSRADLYNSRGKTYFDMATREEFAPQMDSLLALAMQDYNRAIAFPVNQKNIQSEALANRGAIFGIGGDFGHVISDCTEAVRLDPDNKNAYFNRSIAYYNTQQYDHALADYDSYLKLDSTNANIWYESGMLNRALKHNEAAIERLTRSLSINPSMGLAWLERARAHAQAGHKKEAATDYEQAQTMGIVLEDLDKQLMRQLKIKNKP